VDRSTTSKYSKSLNKPSNGNTINKPVIREAVVRALSDQNIENREVEFIISTEAPDTLRTFF
jgi:hypothetical protein